MFNKQIGESIRPKDVFWDTTVGVANTDTQKVVNPNGRRVVVHGVQASYSAAPTGGRLTISDGVSIFDIDIVDKFVSFLCAIPFDLGSNVTIKLFAGGAGVVGKLNFQYILEGE